MLFRSVEEVPLRRPARRISDHPRPAADERDRPTAVQLQSTKRKDAHQMPNMQRVGTRIEPDVGGHARRLRESIVETGAYVVDE